MTQTTSSASRRNASQVSAAPVGFPRIKPGSGELAALHLTPLQIRRMQLVRPPQGDIEWLRQRLADVSRDFGCDVAHAARGEPTLIAQPLAASATDG
jgi:hypothetical protein